MIGSVAKEVAKSLRNNQEDWEVDTYTMTHRSSAFCLWTGNGLWHLGPHDGYYSLRPIPKKFNIVEKLLVYFSLLIGNFSHPLSVILFPFQLFIGLPGGLFIRPMRDVRLQRKRDREDAELKATMSLGGPVALANTVQELVGYMPKNEALTSPNPVIRYYARIRWKKDILKSK